MNLGETAEQALVRELQEELSVQISCGPLLGTGENFFEHDQVRHHEVGLYFAATIPEAADLNAKDRAHWGTEGGQRLEFRWFTAAQLMALDVRPASLKLPLSKGTVPAHFVQEP